MGYTTTKRGAKFLDQCHPIQNYEVETCSNKTNVCKNGHCILENDYYTCSCLPNYIGSHCEARVDSCSSRPCLNGGVCRSLEVEKKPE